MASLPVPILIADAKRFAQVIAELEKAPIVAVDTESNSLYAYSEQVCLIQFSTSENDYLVDTLAIDDVAPLENLFSNPNVEKIFHAAEYDLLCLKRDFGFKFANLFDTMVAAKILGRKKVGLGNLLNTEFNITLEKRFQKADWGKRPLPPEMLSYARLDTHYLIRLRNKFKDALNEKNRWAIAQEDFARLSLAKGKPPGPVDTNIWRINRSRDLSPQQAAVFQELVNYRDYKARSFGIPAFKVLSDKALLAMAESTPRHLSDLKTSNIISGKLFNKYGKGLIDAMKRGLQSKGLKPPPRAHYINGYPERMEALRAWRKTTAIKLDIESDIVLPRDLMIKIASENPATKPELDAIMQSTPWRLDKYGSQIQLVLENQ